MLNLKNKIRKYEIGRPFSKSLLPYLEPEMITLLSSSGIQKFEWFGGGLLLLLHALSNYISQ